MGPGRVRRLCDGVAQVAVVASKEPAELVAFVSLREGLLCNNAKDEVQALPF